MISKIRESANRSTFYIIMKGKSDCLLFLMVVNCSKWKLARNVLLLSTK